MNESIAIDYEMVLRRYIKAQLRRRKILIITHRSKKDESRLWNIINQIERWMQTYPYANGRQLARFFLKHAGDIYQLIPGYGSKCYEAECARLEEMTKLANTIIYES